MKKLITLVLFTFLTFHNFKSSAQVDTSFWFAAPFVSPDNTNRKPYVLHVYTYGASSTTVHLQQPAAIAPNKYDTRVVLPPYVCFNYSFWRDANVSPSNLAFDSLEVKPSDMVVPYGLYISSTSDISAVFDVVTNFNNPETFSLKGLQNGAGLEFLCPFQQKGNNQTLFDLAGTPPGIVQPKQQINIVATKANTTVSITPKCSVVGHPANVTYTILLPNPGSAYTVENASQTTTVLANNLSGSRVTADKPISVTVADDSAKGLAGCYDLVGDQLVPVAVTGKEYVVVRGGLNVTENDGVYLVGTDNSTQITIDDGVVTTTVINKGDTYFYKTNQSVTSVIANKNVYAMQLTGFGCEMGDGLIPPLACAGSSITHVTRNNGQSLYLNLYCKSGVENGFIFNGSSSLVPAAAFTLVPGTAALPGGPYYGAKILFNTTSVPIGSYTIANNIGDFGLSVCNGGATSGSYYHYMTLFSKPFNVTAGSNYSVCANASVLSLSGTVSGVTNTGTWTTANGTGSFGAYTSTVNTIATSYNLSPADQLLSSIKFYLTSTGGCAPTKDSIIVTLTPLPQITITPGTSICSNNNNAIALSSTLTNATSGTWSSSGTGGFFPSNSSPSASYTPSSGDLSTPTFTLNYGATSLCGGTIASAIYTVINTPTVVATTSSSLICVGQNATLTASGANTYSWNTTSTNTSIVVSPVVTTGYYVTGVTNGCSNTVTLTVSVSPCTGIDGATINNELLKIYPNPSNGEFTLSSTTDIKLTLVNELGQLVKSITLNTSNNRSISVTHLANGIYFITGRVNDRSINQKIVVAK